MKLKSIIANRVEAYATKYKTEKARRWALGLEAKNMRHLSLKELTSDEEKSILDVWGPLGLKPYPLFYQLFKTIGQFNPYYLSDDLYYPVILRTLNPDCYSKSFAHKGIFAMLFKEIPQPKVYVCSIGGVLYHHWEMIDKQKAISILSQHSPFIIKPTKGTSCGHGVQLVKTVNEKQLEKMVEGYGDDWIAQEVICQSPLTAQFNPSSVNSFRVTTLFINGKVSTQSICFKVGGKNSVTDNLGSGGVFVGLSPDGQFCELGYDNKYNKYERTPNGISFKDIRMGQVSDLSKKIESFHAKYLPTVGLVGWDVALDKDSNPVVLEANLNFPGIQFEQIAIKTPIFGERTHEVIQYVKDHLSANKS